VKPKLTISFALEQAQREELQLLQERLARRYSVSKVTQGDAMRHALKYAVKNDLEGKGDGVQ
jgi:hypothetical protein